MNFTVSSFELLKAVTAVSKAIPAKTALPILEDFLFELSDKGLRITASDSELTLRTEIETTSTVETGRMTVPAQHIIELLKALPDQPIEIRTLGESSFECKWNSGKSTLPYRPADDYPEIKGPGNDTIRLTVPASILTEGISSTIYATADDEIRPAMNGIFFDIETESATLVASDAHKLVCYTSREFKSEQKTSFILHKKPANILKNLIAKDDTQVEIVFDTNNARFLCGQTEVICRLIIGKYPKYREVIPQNNSNVLRIDRTQFLNTVKRVSVCANRASNHVKLEMSEGLLRVSAQDLGFSLSAQEEIACSYEGQPLTIGFKSTFLSEILNNFACEEIVMKFLDDKRAALILPGENEAEREKLCGIIMPIMIA